MLDIWVSIRVFNYLVEDITLGSEKYNLHFSLFFDEQMIHLLIVEVIIRLINKLKQCKMQFFGRFKNVYSKIIFWEKLVFYL